MQNGPAQCRAICHISNVSDLILAATGRHHGRRIILRHIGDQRIGGQDHRRDAGRVLDGAARDLGRIDDAALHHIFEVAGQNVVADILVILLFRHAADGVDDDRAILTGIAAMRRMGSSSARRMMVMPV